MPKIEWDIKLNFGDVLIRPKRSKLKSRSQVDLRREYTFVNSKQKWYGIPLIVANMDTTGTFEMAVELGKFQCITAIHKHYSVDDWLEFAKKYPSSVPQAAVSSGTSDRDFEKLCEIISAVNAKKVTDEALTVDSKEETTSSATTTDASVIDCKADSERGESLDANETGLPDVKSGSTMDLVDSVDPSMRLRMICLDVANGYSEHFVEFVAKVRRQFPKHIIMAGNVVTGEMTEQLILSGADIVKVGIGPGSVCTTRKKTGVGYPQLSAVLECADAAHGLGGHVISDGGCTMPGDFSKAFGAGADFVMSGGLFSGHLESGGDLVTDPTTGRKFKEFYGMSSAHAMTKHKGKVADYRASEGKYVLVPFKGPVAQTVKTILGGVRSTCTYVGARKLKELSKRTTFIRVASGGHHNVVFGDEGKHQPKSPLIKDAGTTS